jgi:hypothetical protein
MGKMNVSIDVAATPEQAWAVYSDLANAAGRIKGIERIEIITEGPLGVGTKWRETRIMMKKETTEEMEITEWVPCSHYTVYSDSCGSDFVSTVRVTPTGEGCTVAMEMNIKGRTLMGKLMMPLGWLMAGVAKKCMRADLEDLKRHLEGGAADREGRPTPA